MWSWSWSCCPSGFSANIGFSMLVVGGRDSVLAEYLNLDSAPFSEWPFPSNGEFSSLTLKREFSLKYYSNCQLAYLLHKYTLRNIILTWNIAQSATKTFFKFATMYRVFQLILTDFEDLAGQLKTTFRL